MNMTTTMTENKINKMTIQLKSDIGTNNMKSAIIEVALNEIDEYRKQHKHLYELLTGRVKPYFDFELEYDNENDYKLNHETKIVAAYNDVCKAFQKHQYKRVLVFDASGYSHEKKLWKVSAHFIVNNAGCYSCGKAIQFLVDDFQTKGFDKSVYKVENKQQLFRIPYATKKSDPTRTLQVCMIDNNKLYQMDETTYFQMNPNETFADWMISNVGDHEVSDKTVDKQIEKMNSKHADNKQSVASEIERVVMGLSDKRASDYNGVGRNGKWFEVLCAIKNSETFPNQYRQLAHDFSMKCPSKYEKIYVDCKYDSIGDGSLTIATLYDMLKVDNKQLFDELQQEVKLKRTEETAITKEMINQAMKNIEVPAKMWYIYEDLHFVDQMNESGLVDFSELNEYLRTATAYVYNSAKPCWFARDVNEEGTVFYEQMDGMNTPFYGKKDIKVAFMLNGQKVETSFDKLLEETKNTRRYRRFGFYPYFLKEDMPKIEYLNTFTGFSHTLAQCDLNMEKVNFMNDHLLKLVGMDESVHKYVLDWMATCVQKPQKKMPFLVSISRQGAGKGTFFDEFLCQRILGKQYTKSISNPDLLVGHFNEDVKNSLITILNEAKDEGKSISDNEKFKSLTTDVRIQINGKGEKPYEYNNYSKYIVLSNNKNPVYIAADDRRTVVFESDHKHLEDNKREYFDKLHKLKNDKECIEHYFTFLATRDISNFCADDIPSTSTKNRIKQNQLPSPIEHIKYMCEHVILGVVYKSVAELYENYSTWCKGSNVKPSPEKYYKQDIALVGIETTTNALTRKQINGVRKYCVVLDSQVIQAAFQKHLKDKDFKFDVQIDDEDF